MSITRRNNSRAIMAMGAAAAAHKFGELALTGTGKQVLWDGAKFIASKLWNRKYGGNKTRDVVSHPGAQPGAVAAPVAVTRILRASKPKFTRSKGAVTVSHRELVATFSTSDDLVVNAGLGGGVYAINPSNAVLFSWLQTLAVNFDQYRFENLRLQYVPLCGTNATGRIALYFDKDSQDAAPTDRVELANMGHLTETSPWAEASLNIPVDKLKRFTDDSSTADPKLLNLGQVGVASYGTSTVATAGDVFVHYTVTFFEPQPTAGLVTTKFAIGNSAFSVGADLFGVVESSTALAIGFRAVGTYLVAIQLRATTITDDAIVGSTSNSHFNAFSGGVLVSLRNVTISVPSTGLLVSGTGFGNYTINVVRAKKTNTVALP